MFALEIDFQDGVSLPETLFVRRAQAVIGSGENAHVLIEGSSSEISDIRLTRGIGKEFFIYGAYSKTAPVTFREGVYQGEAELSLGDIKLRITSLDVDLLVSEDDMPDVTGVKILRRAISNSSPKFPGVVVEGAVPTVVSFSKNVPLLVGRSRGCGLRIDSPQLSNEHLKITFDGESLVIEDLDSTNGTYVENERVTGEKEIQHGDVVRLAADIRLSFVWGEEDMSSLRAWQAWHNSRDSEPKKYPCLVTLTENVRPARLVVGLDKVVQVGRDPSNDIWIKAAHISRTHMELKCDSEGKLFVTDVSSNGTRLDGEKIAPTEPISLADKVSIFDLGAGVRIALCHNEDEEREFLNPDPVSVSVRREKELITEPQPSKYDQSRSLLDDVLIKQSDMTSGGKIGDLARNILTSQDISSRASKAAGTGRLSGNDKEPIWSEDKSQDLGTLGPEVSKKHGKHAGLFSESGARVKKYLKQFFIAAAITIAMLGTLALCVYLLGGELFQ